MNQTVTIKFAGLLLAGFLVSSGAGFGYFASFTEFDNGLLRTSITGLTVALEEYYDECSEPLELYPGLSEIVYPDCPSNTNLTVQAENIRSFLVDEAVSIPTPIMNNLSIQSSLDPVSRDYPLYSPPLIDCTLTIILEPTFSGMNLENLDAVWININEGESVALRETFEIEPGQIGSATINIISDCGDFLMDQIEPAQGLEVPIISQGNTLLIDNVLELIEPDESNGYRGVYAHTEIDIPEQLQVDTSGLSDALSNLLALIESLNLEIDLGPAFDAIEEMAEDVKWLYIQNINLLFILQSQGVLWDLGIEPLLPDLHEVCDLSVNDGNLEILSHLLGQDMPCSPPRGMQFSLRNSERNTSELNPSDWIFDFDIITPIDELRPIIFSLIRLPLPYFASVDSRGIKASIGDQEIRVKTAFKGDTLEIYLGTQLEKVYKDVTGRYGNELVISMPMEFSEKY